MLIVGHRGARNEAPENTLAGFSWLKRLGAEAVEFDVRLAKDGELVVIHDATVDRTTNATGDVASFTAAELSALDARAQFSDWTVPCGIPRFTDVLDLLGDQLQLMIEIKKDTPEREERIIRGVVQQLHLRKLCDQATITSFDPVALEIVQREFPYQRRGYIGAWDSESFIETALSLGCVQGDAHHVSASAEIVMAAHEAGLSMIGWPCNSKDEYDLLAAWGVEAVTTDQPTMILGLRNATMAGS